jgi:hypothetical protein
VAVVIVASRRPIKVLVLATVRRVAVDPMAAVGAGAAHAAGQDIESRMGSAPVGECSVPAALYF